jgi:hypothetical protein
MYALLYHQACIMLLIAHLEGVNNSWLDVLKWNNFTVAPATQQWYCGVYWVITTVRQWYCDVYWVITTVRQWYCDVYWVTTTVRQWYCDVYWVITTVRKSWTLEQLQWGHIYRRYWLPVDTLFSCSQP